MSIIALHRATADDLIHWGENFGGDVTLLLDDNDDIYDLYRIDYARLQYIVIDRDMTIMYKSSMPNTKDDAEQEVLELLAE